MTATQTRNKSKEIWPDFNLLNYNLSVHKNMNFYSIEVDDNKRKKEWAIDFWKSQNKEVKGLSRVSDSYFVTVGPVAHMLHHRGIDLDGNEREYCNKKYADLIKLIPPETPATNIELKDTSDIELKIHLIN